MFEARNGKLHRKRLTYCSNEKKCENIEICFIHVSKYTTFKTVEACYKKFALRHARGNVLTSNSGR